MASITIDESMTHDYRISKGPDVGEILNSIECLESYARDHGPDATTCAERTEEFRQYQSRPINTIAIGWAPFGGAIS
jgi:hypothetical protein